MLSREIPSPSLLLTFSWQCMVVTPDILVCRVAGAAGPAKPAHQHHNIMSQQQQDVNIKLLMSLAGSASAALCDSCCVKHPCCTGQPECELQRLAEASGLQQVRQGAFLHPMCGHIPAKHGQPPQTLHNKRTGSLPCTSKAWAGA